MTNLIEKRRGLILPALVVLIVAPLAIPTQAAPAFAPRVRVPGSSGYEPGIDVAPNGTIIVNDPSGSTAHGSAWRSTDGGASFTRMVFTSPYNRFPGGFDSDGEFGHDGRYYFADLSVASNSIVRSDDYGQTWAAGTPFSSLPPSDRQWLAVGPKDAEGNETVYILYTQIGTSQMLLARSDDSGQTWTTHVPVPALAGGTGRTSQLVANDDGFVAFTYTSGRGLMLARSLDHGETWSTVQINRLGGEPISGGIFAVLNGLAIDGDTLHVVWISSGTYRTRYARSTDLGATWSDQVDITEPGSNVFPWVAARNGKVGVVWYGAVIDPETPTNPNNVAASTPWFIRYAESLDGGATFAAPVNVNPETVYRGFVCTNGIGCTSGRTLGDFTQVTLDPATNDALVVYGCHVLCAGTYVSRQIS